MGSRDRALAIALVVLLVALAIVAAPREGGPADTRPSSFGTGGEGARLLYLAMEELELPVARRTTPYVGSDSLGGGTLVLLAPSESPSPLELRALNEWLRGGGTLIYAARPDDLTLDSLGLALVSLRPVGQSVRDAVRWREPAATPSGHPWAAGTGSVTGFEDGFADTSRVVRAGATPLLLLPGGRFGALTWPVGKGRVVAFATAEPLRNRAVRQGGAAALFARAAAAAPGRPLRFDEYHHGYRSGQGTGKALLRFLRETGPGRGVLQLAVAALALLLLLGRRFGAAIPPPPARRRSPLEHVEALAGAYRQAGARATARRLIAAGLTRRLGRRPVPGEGADTDPIERVAARLPVAREAGEALRGEWRKGDSGDLVALSHSVDRLLDEVKRP